MSDLASFKRYIQSLDILELSVLTAYSLLTTIGKACMLRFEMLSLDVNNAIE